MKLRRRIKNCIIVSLSILVILLCAFLWFSRPINNPSTDINVMSSHILIAHAGGGIDGEIYTNSKKALINALDKGFRMIELDLYQMNDGSVVCAHDYQMVQKYEQTLMALPEAIEIWEKRPFVFVTDRISDVNILNKYFKSQRKNILVETSSLNNYLRLVENGYAVMLTVSGDLWGLFKFITVSVISGHKVPRIVTNYSFNERVLRIFKRLNVQVAVYTINDVDFLKNHIGKEVDLVYTDFLEPQ